MKNKLLVILIIALALCFTRVTFINAQNIPALYKRCLPAIVKISVLGIDGSASEGTGFFIAENTIVTCYHVADNANTLTIETSDGKKFTVDTVIASNQITDLIKFTVKEKNKTWLTLSGKLPEVGEGTVIIGNPGDSDFSISNGIVSAIGIKNGYKVIQTTAPCSPGSSGSPVIDKKGNVIGVMSYIKYAAQNLNYAASSLHVITMKNDKSIKLLHPIPSKVTKHQMDSIVDLANLLFKIKDYTNALNAILPVIQFADSAQAIEFTGLIGDCHFFNRDYSKAIYYYSALDDKLQSIKKHTPDDVCIYAQTLQKASFCYFQIGDKKDAMEAIEQAKNISKMGLAMDTLRKPLYTLLVQTVYVQDASFKYADDRIFEACLSWKIAKQYGYKKDDLGFDKLCK